MVSQIYANLPLKDLVQYVVKRSGKEIIHHAEIVVCHIFDVGVAELSRTMALIDGFAFIVVWDVINHMLIIEASKQIREGISGVKSSKLHYW